VERARNMVVDWRLANTPTILASTEHHQPSLTLALGAPLLHNLLIRGSTLLRGDTNATLTRLFPLNSIAQVLAFVFVTQKVLLFWPRQSHILV